MAGISVFSEIGPLKRVLLHKPGEEVENLTPDLLPELLFDDIPYLVEARKEHEVFSSKLESHGVEVLYIENLLAETLDISADVKRKFLLQFFHEGKVYSSVLHELLLAYYLKQPTKVMVDNLIAGLRQKDLPNYQPSLLGDLVNDENIFILEPMPNLLFTRDPFASIHNGISLHAMATHVRSRETLFTSFILKYHPEFSKENISLFYNRSNRHSLEGGDVLVLSKEVLLIGISQRTEAGGIERLAKNIFNHPGNTVKKIVAVELRKKRAFMHLDTVLTQVDHDKFTIHAEIKGPMRIFILSPAKTDYGFSIEEVHEDIDSVLAKCVGTSVKMIPCGNGDIVHSQREQWNDGANTLALKPGEVFVYSRNHITNDLLDKNGIKLHIIPSAELSRGRGGPRCMSMPLIREML